MTNSNTRTLASQHESLLLKLLSGEVEVNLLGPL
jgi:hypothetical protein